MYSAYIGMGSNLGDARANLTLALQELAALPGIRLHAASTVYCTEPQGDVDQPWFFNQVAAVNTALSPHELLRQLQEIEKSLGRERSPERRFGPRTLDLDLLYYQGVELGEPFLTLPHPRMWQRAFVLLPLLELAEGELAGQARLALQELNYVLDNDKIFQKH